MAQWARQVGLTSDQALGGASTCHLEARDNCVLDKKNVKFCTDTHHLHGLLELVHVNFGVLSRLHHLKAIGTVSIVDDHSRRCWYTR